MRRTEELPVDVELALFPGTIANAHRAAVPPSRQVIERALAQIVFATDPEHNLQLGAAPYLGRHRASHPGEEPVCLIWAGSDPERFQCQAGVTIQV